MENNKCGTCVHFRQHYVKKGNIYTQLKYGHCVYPRSKRREIDTLACGKYAEQKPEKKGKAHD